VAPSRPKGSWTIKVVRPWHSMGLPSATVSFLNLWRRTDTSPCGTLPRRQRFLSTASSVRRNVPAVAVHRRKPREAGTPWTPCVLRWNARRTGPGSPAGDRLPVAPEPRGASSGVLTEGRGHRSPPSFRGAHAVFQVPAHVDPRKRIAETPSRQRGEIFPALPSASHICCRSHCGQNLWRRDASSTSRTDTSSKRS